MQRGNNKTNWIKALYVANTIDCFLLLLNISKFFTQDLQNLFLKHLLSSLTWILTFCFMSIQQGHWHSTLPDVPDTQHPILAPCGHNVLLTGVSVHTVQWNSVTRPVKEKKNKYIHQSFIQFTFSLTLDECWPTGQLYQLQPHDT